MKQIFVITGQTATGKTNYALRLAAEHDGELVNFDSRQIYKELDIVTGKDRDLIGSTKIWMYDLITPDMPFSSVDYVTACLPILKDILQRGKTPILVGGTYLYLKHLLYNAPVETGEVDWEYRDSLEQKSVPELQELLQGTNKELFDTMNQSDRSNPRRLIRRLEVASETSVEDFLAAQTIEEIVLPKKLEMPELTIQITGLHSSNSDILRERIKKRVEERIANGAVEETSALLKKYPLTAPGLQSIGYPQIADFLDNTISEMQLIEVWSNKEYQYAKRQYTFMKKDSHISWINIP